MFYKFLELSFKEKYAYRFDFYISILASILLIVVQVNVWQALYQESSVAAASLDQMVTYVLLSSIILALTNSEAASKIGRKMEDGSIISDFTKPISFRNYLFAEDLGNNAFRVIFVAFPSVVVTALFFGFSWEGDRMNSTLFFAALALGVLISFYIKYIIGMFVFWLETSWYIHFFVSTVFTLFSGSVIPLWFYPDWLAAVSYVLPFRLIFFEPISIFLNKYSPKDAVSIIGAQVLWLVILVLFERLLWFNAQKKIVVHGG
ncbi:ABC transporter permease [Paenibacillus medicaginis]|uniref:ABC transporter permease n=1 Tax=Paenibacillus medicaginis TaxID=1470560 RepID=UPI0035CCF60E